ncbi:hypothetical protein PSE_0060 [Pseudovibrio sp. FO-BEG1]|nr:hypothetical protein PSE_0060 [Pseudovibrio sp. FO-BEG1]
MKASRVQILWSGTRWKDEAQLPHPRLHRGNLVEHAA